MTTIFKHQGPALLWALFLAIVCSVDFGGVGKSHLFFPGFDKVTHCGLFFVMVTAISRGYICKYQHNYNYLHALKALVISIAYGGAIELLQMYVFTWRSGEWPDLFCDIIGGCMATFGILVTLKAAKYAKV